MPQVTRIQIGALKYTRLFCPSWNVSSLWLSYFLCLGMSKEHQFLLLGNSIHTTFMLLYIMWTKIVGIEVYHSTMKHIVFFSGAAYFLLYTTCWALDMSVPLKIERHLTCGFFLPESNKIMAGGHCGHGCCHRGGSWGVAACDVLLMHPFQYC